MKTEISFPPHVALPIGASLYNLLSEIMSAFFVYNTVKSCKRKEFSSGVKPKWAGCLDYKFSLVVFNVGLDLLKSQLCLDLSWKVSWYFPALTLFDCCTISLNVLQAF